MPYSRSLLLMMSVSWARTFALYTTPVGLLGELIRTTLVLGLRLVSKACRSG